MVSVSLGSSRVGVVAIGRNEGARLTRCLRSLATARDVKPAAVIYVDSGSSDGSTDRAREAGATVLQLDTEVPFTAARARNEGWLALRRLIPGLDFIMFVDGDCEVDADWLGKGLTFLTANPKVAVVCGRRRERFPRASVYNRLCDMEWDTPIGEARACGGDSIMRMAALEQAGGFRSSIMAGEEPELCARLGAAGWQIWRLDADMTVHDAAMTRFAQWWNRSVRSGFGYAQVWSATRGSASPLYARELLRSAGWAAVVPIAILGSAMIHPLVAMAGLSLYPLQAARIAVRRGAAHLVSWQYGALMLTAKFAETLGALKFLAGARERPATLIEYKSA